MGLATVYRTLDLLVTSGLVAQRDFGEGFKRYEPVPPGQAHEHCICSACGRVMEFSNDRLERMIGSWPKKWSFDRTITGWKSSACAATASNRIP